MSNIWRVRTAITGGSGASQLSTHFFDQAAGLTAQGAADAVHAFWDAIKGKIVNTYSFQVEHVVEDIDYTTGKPTGLTPVTAALVTGTVNNFPNPWATQALVSWRTGLFSGGREIRGRTFIPGTLQADTVNGAPQAALVTLINTAATTLATDPNSSLCIFSRKKHAVGIVTSGQCWDKFAVLRSRRD